MHHWAELRGRPARYRQPQGSDLGIVADAPSRRLPYLRNVPTPAPSEGDTDVLQPRVHQSSPGRARASPASGQTSSSGETGESRDRSGASSATIPASPGPDRISHQDRLIDRRTVLLDPPTLCARRLCRETLRTGHDAGDDHAGHHERTITRSVAPVPDPGQIHTDGSITATGRTGTIRSTGTGQWTTS